MKHYIVCVRDIKADLFHTPGFVPTIGGAIREFGDQVNREDKANLLYQHPEDFELYHLGNYDDNSALFELLDRPKQLTTGSAFVKEK